LIFLLNYSDQPQTITLRKAVADVLAEQTVQGEIVLAPFDVRILAETDTPAQ
jgi:beta-galactosidase GanA